MRSPYSHVYGEIFEIFKKVLGDDINNIPPEKLKALATELTKKVIHTVKDSKD
jgi:hypothetical protein